MKYPDMVRTTGDRIGFVDLAEAEQTLRAVLRTVTERVPADLADHLATQLPHELGDVLRPADPATEAGHPRTVGERFDLTSFVGRVAWRAGVSEDTALRRSAAVLEVLDAAVAPESMERLTRVLPPDIRALLPRARASGPPIA
ncbi:MULTISPECIES: DUF2267 domain-containing protein [unclassified Streptomyces]|uniref:DUF2267 domain-containing protein n=1 Tax=unclassified Streptomyces TaxID=2593676 RepID=UPI001F04F36F|nr:MULTISPECIES: DUF2267 domain-containing protein [unclassified Streptomyces]MCH0562436.1 DUF2267 domain-containing protein [Streptomyces sp. MUM 2J]MCH0570412.1 DUF2267 domain-containing protein [Streptomyces sp. MUM 136J]